MLKNSYEVREDLYKYLKYLESQSNNIDDSFHDGKIAGIKIALDFIDGYLYYKDNDLYNKC